MRGSIAIAIVAAALCALAYADVGRQYLSLLAGVATAVPTVEKAYRERTQRLDAAIEASGG